MAQVAIPRTVVGRIIFCLHHVVRCSSKCFCRQKDIRSALFFRARQRNKLYFCFQRAYTFQAHSSTSCTRIHILTSLLLHFERAVSLTNDFRLKIHHSFSCPVFFGALIFTFETISFSVASLFFHVNMCYRQLREGTTQIAE